MEQCNSISRLRNGSLTETVGIHIWRTCNLKNKPCLDDHALRETIEGAMQERINKHEYQTRFLDCIKIAPGQSMVYYLLRIHIISYWTYTRNTSQHNKLGNHAGWLTWRDSLLLCLCIQSLRVRRTQGAVSSHWGRTVQGLCLDILSDTMTPLEISEHLWEKS